MKVRLIDAAEVIRSKNAGPYELTLDIMFKDREMFERFVASGCIDAELIAQLYRLQPEDVLCVVDYAPALAIKATIKRPVCSGDFEDRDVYGAQQHAPLMDLEVDLL